MAGIVVTTPPSGSLVLLADQKNYMRVDTSADDSLITEMIGAAADWLERETRQVFITRSVRQYFDSFPWLDYQRDIFGVAMGGFAYGPYGYAGPQAAPPSLYREFALDLDRGCPAQSVSAVTYLANGTPTVWGSGNYVVDTVRKPGRVSLVPGGAWPIADRVPNSVYVDYVAGYGAAQSSAIPPIAVRAIRWIVSHYYEAREQYSAVNLAELRSVQSVVEQLMFRESAGA